VLTLYISWCFNSSTDAVGEGSSIVAEDADVSSDEVDVGVADNKDSWETAVTIEAAVMDFTDSIGCISSTLL
jgi:hypothetical protein